LWKLVQQNSFHQEIEFLSSNKPLPKGNRLEKLDPFIDEDGILHVGGRISRASLSFETHHPIILPKDSHSVKLLVTDSHERVSHQGRGFTINSLRSRVYWVLGCHRLVSSLIFQCVICRKLRSKPMTQKMADLPRDRTEPSPPFTHCGIDCFGPFNVMALRKEGTE
jgi:hypothetical protein